MNNWLCFIFLGTLGWGSSLYLIKILLVTLSPSEILLYRMTIGALTLFALSKPGFTNKQPFKYLLLDGFVVGIFNMTVPLYLTSLAEKTISSSLASVLNGLTPLFTFLISIGLFAKRPPFYILNALAIVLGLVGTISVNSDFGLNQNHLTGILALMATSLSYGIAANYIKSYAKTTQPLLVAAMAAYLSTLMVFFFKLVQSSPSHWNVPHDLRQMLALIWLGAVGSGTCLYLYFFLIHKMGAMTASMTTYLMTVTGVLLGTIYLHESLSTMSVFGCICIVLSLLINNHAGQLHGLFKRYRA